MPLSDIPVRTIACDAAGCANAVTFARTDEKAVFEDPKNAWLKTTRTISTADGRVLLYCSDTHEVEGVATGKHNIPEPPKIVPASNPQAVAMAAQSAAAARATVCNPSRSKS